MINLSTREIKLLKLLASTILVIVVYFLIVSPLISYKANLEKEHELNVSKLEKLESLYEKYRELKKQKNQYSKILKSDVGLTSQIENYSKEFGILKNKAYTRDHPSIIQNKFKKITTDVKFESVNIKPVLEFIHKIESTNKQSKIVYLRIHQAVKEKKTYDVIIKIDSYLAQ